MAQHHDDRRPISIPLPELKALAATVADELASAAAPVPADLRARFIEVRAALFQRGIYDPVLVRFDSATAPKATPQQVGEQLAALAASLG